MKVAIVFAVVFAVLANTAYSKDFKLKVRNAITDKEENDDIKVDKNRGTEIIVTSDGHQSMKDFNTGYTAVKNKETKECLIIKSDSDDQKNVTDLEKDLETIARSKKEPEVVQEDVKDIESSQNLTEKQRSTIGQNLIDFCGDFKIVLGATEDDADEDGVPDGEAEEVDEDESEEDEDKDSQVGSRKKRALCTRKQLYRQRVCIRRRYKLRIRYCCSSIWGVCSRYCYRYRYLFRTTCYNRYFWKYYIYNC